MLFHIGNNPGSYWHFEISTAMFIILALLLVAIGFIAYVRFKAWRNGNTNSATCADVAASAMPAVPAIPSQITNFSNGKKREKVCSYDDIDNVFDKLKEPALAIVKVSGPIVDKLEDLPPLVRESVTSGPDLYRALWKLALKKNVACVLMLLDTPGGTMTGSFAIFHGMVGLTAAGKPTVAYIERGSYSGGVISMLPAGAIIMHPNATIGSIGVIGAEIVRMEGVTSIGNGLNGLSYKAREIRVDHVYAGEGKVYYSPFAKDDPKIRARIQKQVDRLYEQFVVSICATRKISIDGVRKILGSDEPIESPEEAIKKLGAAWIFNAHEAMEINLIDAIGFDFDLRTVIVKNLSKQLNRPFTWDSLMKIEVVPARTSTLTKFIRSVRALGQDPAALQAATQSANLEMVRTLKSQNSMMDERWFARFI